jgi:protein SCO1/2
MTRQLRVTLITAAFLACFTIVLGAALFLMSARPLSAPQAAAIGGPFRLIDQNGRTTTEQDLSGHPSLVFFGFTHCPDVCPTTLFDMSQVMQALGADADRARGVFITVDPERDTQPVLKEYLSSFDPHLSGLTGELAAISAVAKEYRVYFKKVPLDRGDYTMDHSAIVYLMDKQYHFVSPFNLKRTPKESAVELRRYL